MSEKDQGLIDAILDFDEDFVLEEVKKMKDSGRDPVDILEIAKGAMEQVGKMFQEKEIFLTELIMSGELFNIILEELGFTEEQMASQAGEGKGKILLGTVEKDVHDIGKNILKGLLVSNGYEVKDIGVDVPITKFVEAAKNYAPQVVAMSGLLTIAYDSMRDTIKAFQEANISDTFKVIIGGGAIDQQVADYAGADLFGESAIDGLEKIKNVFEEA